MEELQQLKELASPATVADLHRLQTKIQTHLDVLDEERFSNEFIDFDLASHLGKTLQALISEAGDFDADQRALPRGGIEYFLLTADADNDLTSPNGLEDDARVVNFVCEQLRRPELVVEMPG